MNLSVATPILMTSVFVTFGVVFAQESVLFKIDIERDGDALTSFDGTLVVNFVEAGALRTMRVPGVSGSLRDSIHLDHTQQEFAIARSEVFGNNQDIAKLSFFVLSSRYMPRIYPTFIRSNESELRAAILLESKALYRAKADGVRMPLASVEIRRTANLLDPVTHSELIKQLEEEARIEEELENRQAAVLNEPLSLLLPAYIYPPDPGALADRTNRLAQLNANDWATVEKDVGKLVRLGIECNIIVNPPIGPQAAVDKQYEAKIAMLRKIKARPIGYVRLGEGTGEGRVYDTMESVEQQIAIWWSLYPQIEGFFFDTCPTDEASFDGINKIATSIKQRSPGAKIVINPGAIPHENYLNSKSIDIICAFESNLDAASLAKFPVTNSNLAAILWDSKRSPEAEIATLRPKGFSSFYITDRSDTIDLDGIPGPDANLQWGRLPSLNVWNNLLNSLARSKNPKK